MGVYFHIPYCRKACHYCDFHFSTKLNTIDEMVSCMQKEIELQKDFLNKPIETIYFGGGTPSILSVKNLDAIFSSLYNNLEVISNPEVTIECNPDDLDISLLKDLKSLGVNRLSIGIQSLIDQELVFMNRSHNASQALQAIDLSRESGFDNINLDIIFGIPGGSLSQLLKTLNDLLKTDPEHLSMYGMTIEPKTVFGNWVKKGRLVEESEENSAKQFEEIMLTLQSNGYEQYEISNFAKPGFESRHNSNYWKGYNYLGIGPGAHSYNGIRRQANIRNNHKYIKAIKAGELDFDFEDLTRVQMINEYIMTSIRTKWGCNLNFLKKEFGLDLFGSKKSYIDELIRNDLATLADECLFLTSKGKLIADSITESLFQE